MIVRRRYDETRINGFIRLQDMAQRKMADNDDKDCDGSEIIFVKKSTYLARYKVLHQKKVSITTSSDLRQDSMNLCFDQ